MTKQLRRDYDLKDYRLLDPWEIEEDDNLVEAEVYAIWQDLQENESLKVDWEIKTRNNWFKKEDSNKERYDLIPVSFLNRFSEHLRKGADKYEEWNWVKADSQEDLNSMKESAFRHFMQWMDWDDDEDHFSAAIFNMMVAEHIKNWNDVDWKDYWEIYI